MADSPPENGRFTLPYPEIPCPTISPAAAVLPEAKAGIERIWLLLEKSRHCLWGRGPGSFSKEPKLSTEQFLHPLLWRKREMGTAPFHGAAGEVNVKRVNVFKF